MFIEISKCVFSLLTDSYWDMDYSSYREQAQQYLDGELNYKYIIGNRGQWYYPALHLYTYALIHQVTDNYMYPLPAILTVTAVHIFVCVFAVKIYQEAFGKDSKNVLLVLLWCLSTKPTINVTRYAFSDDFNVLFTYIGIYLFQKHQNLLGSIFIAIGLGYKMNVMMYLPALLLIVALSSGVIRATLYFIMVFILQEVWALEFNLAYPYEYNTYAFNLAKGFKWETSRIYLWIKYENKRFYRTIFYSVFLMILILLTCLYFLIVRWAPLLHKNRKFSMKLLCQKISLWPIQICPDFEKQDPYFIAEAFFLCNFAGIVWARSLHQQFLIWYWFSIPFIMYTSLLEKKMTLQTLACSVILLGGCFSVGGEPLSAFATFILHLYCLALNFFTKTPSKDDRNLIV